MHGCQFDQAELSYSVALPSSVNAAVLLAKSVAHDDPAYCQR